MSRPVTSRRATRACVGATAIVGLGLLAACGGGGTAVSPPSESASPLPGITDETVSVGYTVLEGDALQSATDGARPDDSDPLIQAEVIKAYVDFVNASGGAGGRRVVAQISGYDAVTASRDQALELCADFTTTKKVFAAVLDGNFEDDALSCYRDASTLMLDETLVAHDTEQFEQFSPYLWSPTHPEYSAFLQAQLASMRADGFFDDVDGVQIIAADTEVARRATGEVVEPFLASAGVTKTEVSVVDISNSGTLATSTAAALSVGTTGGYERVVTVGGGPTMSAALADQGADFYLATWGVSTFDAPGYVTANPARIVTSRLAGASGLGYSPAYDLEGERGGPFPDPARPAEAVCKGVLDAAGVVLGDGERADYRSAFQYCDATLFLKAALDRVPAGTEVTGRAFADAVGRVGTGYTSSLTLGGSLSPGQYAATNAGRVLSFDASCACFQYKGENVPITAN